MLTSRDGQAFSGRRIIGMQSIPITMLPLQAEGTYVLAGVFLVLLIAGSTGYWVYIDGATRKIDRAPWWGAGVFWLLLLGVIPGLIALALYLSKRPARPN